MNEPKVIRFPSTGRRSRSAPASPDEKLAADIRSAWRKLSRAIGAARVAGLQVQTRFDPNDPPVIERRL